VSEKAVGAALVRPALLILLTLAIWVAALMSEDGWRKSALQILGWTVLGWAALTCLNGVPWFLGVVAVFILVHVLIPALRRLWTLPQKPEGDGGAATAVAALLVTGLTLWSFGNNASAAAPGVNSALRSPVPESIAQQVRVQDQFAVATAKVRWQAEKGQICLCCLSRRC